MISFKGLNLPISFDLYDPFPLPLSNCIIVWNIMPKMLVHNHTVSLQQ